MVRAGVPPPAAVAAGFAYVNSQSYRAQGMEVSFEEAPRADLRVLASYTYLDAEITEAFGDEAINPSFPDIPIGQYSAILGGRPFRRPANAGTFGVIYSPSRFEIALSAYFSGKRDDSTFLSDPFYGSTLLLPNKDLDSAYQKVDLSGGVNVHPRLKIYTSLENLLNQDYEASFGFPALPLTARIGARVTLGGDR